MQSIKKILKLLWKGWMTLARVLGYVQTHIILFLIYVFIVGPISVLARLFRINLMDARGDFENSFWHVKPPLDETEQGLARQF